MSHWITSKEFKESCSFRVTFFLVNTSRPGKRSNRFAILRSHQCHIPLYYFKITEVSLIFVIQRKDCDTWGSGLGERELLNILKIPDKVFSLEFDFCAIYQTEKFRGRPARSWFLYQLQYYCLCLYHVMRTRRYSHFKG